MKNRFKIIAAVLCLTIFGTTAIVNGASAETVTIEEQVLYDANDIKITVNGFMTEAMLSADVVAGKKANDSLTFITSELEKCGIESIADMGFSFHIFNSES